MNTYPKNDYDGIRFYYIIRDLSNAEIENVVTTLENPAMKISNLAASVVNW